MIGSWAAAKALAGTFTLDGQTYAPGTSGDTLIIPLPPGEHTFEIRALEQPAIFRNWQVW